MNESKVEECVKLFNTFNDCEVRQFILGLTFSKFSLLDKLIAGFPQAKITCSTEK